MSTGQIGNLFFCFFYFFFFAWTRGRKRGDQTGTWRRHTAIEWTKRPELNGRNATALKCREGTDRDEHEGTAQSRVV
jgi:hypothetical protein